MLNRDACERRVYRLASLLTGNPNAATQVIEQVVSAQPNLDDMDTGRLDRLTVLRAREIPTAAIVVDGVPMALAEALAALPPQQREAWVLGRVFRLPLREMARAMDCSRQASQHHLDLAAAALRPFLSDAQLDPAERLLQHTFQLDVPAFFRARQQRRRRVRLALRIAVVLIIIGILAGVAMFAGT